MLDNKVHGNNWDKSDPNALKKQNKPNKKNQNPQNLLRKKKKKKKKQLNFQI